jgi:hypothetical protein
MKSSIKLKVFIIVFFILLISCYSLSAQKNNWKKAEEGLYIGEFESPQKSIIGDSKIIVIKIDPTVYSIKLLCAKQNGLPAMTAKEWCREFGLIACVNAGMFQKEDCLSNVGYMKNFKHVNNTNTNDFQSVFAFNPINSKNPQTRIFDMNGKNIDDIINNYNTVIQNLRLIKRPGQNRWPQQDNRWSEMALGEDKQGNILFIFCRSPYSMHDFNNILLQLPINIVCAQHLEGGPEASLYFSYKGIVINKFGSYETQFNKNDNNDHAWIIPNVLGIAKKK